MQDKFNLNDVDRIEMWSKFLSDNKKGWIDTKISEKIIATDIPPISDELLRDIQPSVWEYLNSVPRYYWIIITIPNGVTIDNQYLTNTSSAQLNYFCQLKGELLQERIGELLFYRLDQNAILGLVKVNQPCAENVNQIKDKLQKFENNLSSNLSERDNSEWKVRLSKVDRYYDIPVMLNILNNND